MGSPSLISLMVSVDVKHHGKRRRKGTPPTAALPTGPDAACRQTCALTAGRGKSGEGEVARREELTA